jgi:hypothetical protein
MTAEDIKSDTAGAEHRARKECPIDVLGQGPGRLIYMVSPSGAFHAITTDRLTGNAILGVFESGIKWLWLKYPRQTAEGDITGIRFSAVVEFLILWAADKGPIDPDGMIRGVGYWPGDPLEGASPLIVHCGDRVLIDESWQRPGLISGKVYLAAPKAPRPASKPMPPAADGEPERYAPDPLSCAEAEQIRKFLGRWRWRDEASPTLLLGWLAGAHLPGVLDWRPHLWISGDRSTGKSTLQAVIKGLLGETLLNLADTTEAGVRQQLGGGARPVALDEIEPDDESNRAGAVVKLARLASQKGGGRVARGSGDGVATVTSIDAVFLFSSILRPPLSPQDLQRITVLDLEPIEADNTARAAVIAERAAIVKMGPALQARIIDQWPRYEQTLGLYQACLISQGHENRAADQIGTLLALADLMLRDEMPDKVDALLMCELFPADDLAERLDDSPDHERCLVHLLTSYPPMRTFGAQKTIGSALGAYIEDNTDEPALADVRQCGISITHVEGEPFLAVANTHQGVAAIYASTHWRSTSGATGAWVQALRRVPGSRPASHPVRFAGNRARATLIPLTALPLESVATVAGTVAGGVAGQPTDHTDF